MTTFWIIAFVLSLLAAAFILIPVYLARRSSEVADRTAFNVEIFEERRQEYQQLLDQGDIDTAGFEALVLELKRNLLAETRDAQTTNVEADPSVGRLPVVLAVLVPVFAVLAYSDAGLSWGSISDVALAEEINSVSPHDTTGVELSVDKLATRLLSQPDNHEGWFLLGQSFLKMGRFEESAGAFRHLLDTFTDDYSIWAFYAEALYMADERRITERVSKAIEQTLKLNPHDLTMLEIKAIGRYQAGDLKGAIDGLRAVISAGAEGERAQFLEQAIARMEHELGGDAGELSNQGSSSESKPASQGSIRGQEKSADKSAVAPRRIQVLVEAAGHIAVAPDTPVFVYARAVAGPPMPLAVRKLEFANLPTLVTLDESMAMMAGMGLANFDQVQVIARISATGIANASPNDYQAMSAHIELKQPQSVIKLVIEKKVKDFKQESTAP